jgi:phospholipid/cholesterol/gamma-HCH transport system substrate-binding protein
VAPTGRLHDGSVIPLERTNTDATIEEVLGALSLLLDGGGIGKLQTISHELSTAMKGREGVTRDLLIRLNGFVTGLDRQKGSIISALEGLDRLARAVRGQESSLVQALDDMPDALHTLSEDRGELVKMLSSLRRFGDVASEVVTRSHDDLVGNLRDLRPTLSRLAEVGETIPEVLTVLITYPTADSVEQEYFGDYGNLALTMDVSAKSLLNTFGPLGGLPGVPAKSTKQQPLKKKAADAVGGLGTLPTLPDLAPVTRWATGKTFEDLMLGALS